METVAWMVGREGGVTELLFDAPVPPFQISKELVFRDDATPTIVDAPYLEQLCDSLDTMAYAYVARDIDKQRIEAAHWIRRLHWHLRAKQAKIDRLMLEYCPDEMTAEQKAAWKQHQRPYTLSDIPTGLTNTEGGR